MRHQQYTKEEIINKLQNFYKENGEISFDIYKNSKHKPTITTIRRVFGSWSIALQNANIPIRKYKYSPEEMLRTLKKFYEDNDCQITYSQYEKSKTLPSGTTIIDYFGSWNKALIAAEIPISKELQKRKCIICSKEFAPRHSSKVYCSSSCFQKNYREINKRIRQGLCVKCGSELVDRILDRNDNSNFKWKCHECNHEYITFVNSKTSNNLPKKK